MPLTIGGTLGPCPPCKVILNGGFMAVLARLLASDAHFSVQARDAAGRLAVAAETHVKMLAVVGVAVGVRGDWGGCDQAADLILWLSGADVEPDDMVKLMDRWAASEWSAISDLAAGKIPT